jgi:hypothetical protein
LFKPFLSDFQVSHPVLLLCRDSFNPIQKCLSAILRIHYVIQVEVVATYSPSKITQFLYHDTISAAPKIPKALKMMAPVPSSGANFNSTMLVLESTAADEVN